MRHDTTCASCNGISRIQEQYHYLTIEIVVTCIAEAERAQSKYQLAIHAGKSIQHCGDTHQPWVWVSNGIGISLLHIHCWMTHAAHNAQRTTTDLHESCMKHEYSVVIWPVIMVKQLGVKESAKREQRESRERAEESLRGVSGFISKPLLYGHSCMVLTHGLPSNSFLRTHVPSHRPGSSNIAPASPNAPSPSTPPFEPNPTQLICLLDVSVLAILEAFDNLED